MVDPASIKYALIYEHINQEMGVDQIITEQLSIYLTRHLWYIDPKNTMFIKKNYETFFICLNINKVLAVKVFTVHIKKVLD